MGNSLDEKGQRVDLKAIDKGRPRGLNENEMPGAVTGAYGARTVGRGDLPYDRPADDTRNLTTPAAILSNNDRLTVGTSSGQFFGSSGELGDGEMDWRTPEVRGDSQGPSVEETVGRMPGLRDTSLTIKTVRRWEDTQEWAKPK